MKVNILGVEIDDFSVQETLSAVSDELQAGKRVFIATPNPEMLVLAQRDAGFKEILNRADIKIPDGAGLKLGAKILGKELKNRVTGTDLMEKLCGLSAEHGYKIYLLGAQNGVARIAAENLKKKFPGLMIAGAEYGGKMPVRREFGCHIPEAERRYGDGPRGGDEWDNRVIIEHINAVAPEMLFVALGHGRQERWIAENFEKLPSIKLAMGVGGAFDFFAGRAKRAPQWMRSMGLEWLWRLIKEPKRYKRIFTAIIIFPFYCLMYACLNFCAAPRNGAKK